MNYSLRMRAYSPARFRLLCTILLTSPLRFSILIWFFCLIWNPALPFEFTFYLNLRLGSLSCHTEGFRLKVTGISQFPSPWLMQSNLKSWLCHHHALPWFLHQTCLWNCGQIVLSYCNTFSHMLLGDVMCFLQTATWLFLSKKRLFYCHPTS